MKRAFILALAVASCLMCACISGSGEKTAWDVEVYGAVSNPQMLTYQQLEGLEQKEIEKQLVIVVALDKEVKSLEKLREKQWEEYQAETIREENERILEMVSSRFAAEQKENAESRQDD